MHIVAQFGKTAAPIKEKHARCTGNSNKPKEQCIKQLMMARLRNQSNENINISVASEAQKPHKKKTCSQN